MSFPQGRDLPWASYRRYPERLNITREVLSRQVEQGFGERPALLYDGGMLTYSGLERRVDALARGLKRLGLKRGDLILIRMPNSLEFATGFLAAVKLGALPVLVNSLLGTAELATILHRARPRMALTEASRAGSLRGVRRGSSVEKIVCARGAEGGPNPGRSGAGAAGGVWPGSCSFGSASQRWPDRAAGRSTQRRRYSARSTFR